MIDFRRNPDIYKAFYEGIIDEPFEGSGTIETDESEEASGGGIIRPSRPGSPGFDQETRFKRIWKRFFNTDLPIELSELEAKSLQAVWKIVFRFFEDFEDLWRPGKNDEVLGSLHFPLEAVRSRQKP